MIFQEFARKRIFYVVEHRLNKLSRLFILIIDRVNNLNVQALEAKTLIKDETRLIRLIWHVEIDVLAVGQATRSRIVLRESVKFVS